jgi:Glycosyl transferase family 2
MNTSIQEQPASAQESRPADRSPRMSVILATDTYETIRAVVERFRRQTMCREIELIVVAPETAAVDAVLAYREEFAAIRIVEAPITSVASARAEGIRSATAPVLFIGETHSYPHPDLAEILMAASTNSWSAVTPAIGNANPKGALSWAGLLSDYGRWAEGLPAGEIPTPPPHNAAYRRDVLLELEDRLEPALGLGDELPRWMQARGYRTYFEPAAQIDHANVTRPKDWMRERFVAGWVIASNRAERWSLARRLVYVGGSFLIPAVLMWRVLPGVWQTVRRRHLPIATIPAMVAAAVLKSVGELCGYAGGAPTYAEHYMLEYEVHKLAYLAHSRA